MTRSKQFSTLVLMSVFTLVAAACSPAAQPTPTALPLPTPVTANAEWTPVEQAFEGIDMVLVPAGCFTMGSEDSRRDERPAHEQCFTQAYWIGKTEVTNAQFGSEGVFPGENRPRTNLTWTEARDFCAAKGMRLPSEAEWEYAARGVDNLIYPWGNELDETRLVFDRNSNNQAADVGSIPEGVSWVGALDMSGNVFEWVSSTYARYPFDPADGRENPDPTGTDRVFRGGINSYIDFGVSGHVRFRLEAEGRDWFVGFRCARAL